MKIAFISPNKASLQEMCRSLEAESHSVFAIEGGKGKMRSVVTDMEPDILIVEGMCCDVQELEQIEYVTTHFPKVAVVLLCSTNSPEFLINSMRVGVREVLPSPVSLSALNAAINRIAAKRSVLEGKTLGKVLAFMPCKGGSGATFLATNFGYQLAEAKSVLLIDLNLQFGDALYFVHDSKPLVTIADVTRDISRLDASFLAASAVRASENYSILAAPEDPSQAMEIKPEHIDKIIKLATSQYDFVLLDLPRTLDTVSIKGLDAADRIFPVLQAGIPHLRNAGKLLNVFKTLEYPKEKIELIINRFDRKSEIGLDDMRKSLGGYVLHTMPNSFKEVNTSINHGNPMIEIARTNIVTRHLAEFARSLSEKREEPRSLLTRLLKRA